MGIWLVLKRFLRSALLLFNNQTASNLCCELATPSQDSSGISASFNGAVLCCERYEYRLRCLSQPRQRAKKQRGNEHMRQRPKAFRPLLAISVSVSTLVSAPSMSLAGAFAPREQSAEFLGSAFAGNAAGGALSSMFWNPAAIGQFNGIWSESAFSLVLPHVEVHALPGSTLVPLFSSDSDDMGRDAVVPASYFSYELSKDVVFGLSINAPFGLITETKRNWAGQTLGRKGKIETYNFAPTIAYRVAPGFIVGAGLQVEYFRTKLVNAVPALAPTWPSAIIKGDDIAFGFTLGALWEPAPGTSIGLGFRSSIDQDLEGTLGTPGFGESQIAADVELPELVTLSLRQDLAPKWTALATVEWSNWDRLDKIDFVCRSAGGLCPAAGTTVNTLELGWHDGRYFAGGLEYDYSPKLTLRGGVAYELSPIQDPEERLVLLPDSNRLHLSLGASYDLKWCGPWCDESTLSIAYTHTLFEDATINRTEGAAFPVTLVGTADSSADLIAVGFKTKWSGGGGATGASALK
jgi:long-chain fatty acid transport protein